MRNFGEGLRKLLLCRECIGEFFTFILNEEYLDIQNLIYEIFDLLFD